MTPAAAVGAAGAIGLVCGGVQRGGGSGGYFELPSVRPYSFDVLWRSPEHPARAFGLYGFKSAVPSHRLSRQQASHAEPRPSSLPATVNRPRLGTVQQPRRLPTEPVARACSTSSRVPCSATSQADHGRPASHPPGRPRSRMASPPTRLVAAVQARHSKPGCYALGDSEPLASASAWAAGVAAAAAAGAASSARRRPVGCLVPLLPFASTSGAPTAWSHCKLSPIGHADQPHVRR